MGFPSWQSVVLSLAIQAHDAFPARVERRSRPDAQGDISVLADAVLAGGPADLAAIHVGGAAWHFQVPTHVGKPYQ